MHKHPVPLEIKNHIMAALVTVGDKIDSVTISKVYNAIDDGIRAANIAHTKKKEAING